MLQYCCQTVARTGSSLIIFSRVTAPLSAPLASLEASGRVVAISKRGMARLGNNRTRAPLFVELNRRREKVELNQKLKGEEPIIRRSTFTDWNYAAELTAFSARIGETFNTQKLSEAFVTERYIQAEIEKQKDLGIENISSGLQSQNSLAEAGHSFLDTTLAAWLRGAFPALPEEGVQAVKKHLLGEEVLATISYHIGTRELILCEEYPPSRYHFANTFKALVGALCHTDIRRAQQFVIDTVGVQLIGKDLNEIWEIVNPMGVLSRILEHENRGLPEARLLWQSGPSTLLAAHHVGIYSDQQLIGESAGENLDIAEEMAARDALRRLFRTGDAMRPAPLDPAVSQATPRPSVNTWTSQSVNHPIENLVTQ